MEAGSDSLQDYINVRFLTYSCGASSAAIRY